MDQYESRINDWFVSAVSCSAVAAALDEVITQGVNRIVLDMNEEYNYAIVPWDYDKEEDPDGLLENIGSPYAVPPVMTDMGIRSIASKIHIPVCAAIAKIRLGEDDSFLSDTMGMRDYGTAIGRLTALYITGNTLGEKQIKELAADLKPLNGISPREILDRALDALESRFEPGALEYDADDKGMFCEVAFKKDTPTLKPGSGV